MKQYKYIQTTREKERNVYDCVYRALANSTFTTTERRMRRIIAAFLDEVCFVERCAKNLYAQFVAPVGYGNVFWEKSGGRVGLRPMHSYKQFLGLFQAMVH